MNAEAFYEQLMVKLKEQREVVEAIRHSSSKFILVNSAVSSTRPVLNTRRSNKTVPSVMVTTPRFIQRRYKQLEEILHEDGASLYSYLKAIKGRIPPSRLEVSPVS